MRSHPNTDRTGIGVPNAGGVYRPDALLCVLSPLTTVTQLLARYGVVYRQVDESATSLPSVGHGTPALPGDGESEQIGVSALRWGL